MTLHDADATIGLWHLTCGAACAGEMRHVFYHAGERYGPFVTREHARFVQWHLGWREDIFEMPMENRTARADCNESVTE